MEVLPPLKKPPLDRMQLVRYAGASGDFNPLHYDDETGKAAGTGGVIAHGMLLMGFAGQAVTRWIPNRYLKRLSVRFVDITRPGDQITVNGRITGKRLENGRGLITGEVWAADQQDTIKLKGIFEAELPVKG
ncbi:hypothetical protein A6M21_12030 [Desulfotomaculum copahuensis]|uniref:MaoC-like domain-containing protein n=2 Tax=Desulfotomaculum copahuensis TaxID=1838280 RepID=A0A1B7LDF9_9FIRM|nr:hypothetical protein A6M21_12030 [Desulfotomaculum copahuensis]